MLTLTAVFVYCLHARKLEVNNCNRFVLIVIQRGATVSVSTTTNTMNDKFTPKEKSFWRFRLKKVRVGFISVFSSLILTKGDKQ